MTTTRVHLLRHGEVHNPEGVLYGRIPGYRLSTRGEAMAERVAAVLGERPVVRVVSSPLERAQQTAAPLAAALGVEVAIDDRLIEAGNAFEGLTVGVGDGALRSPRYWPLLRNPFRPSWGEPYVEIAARMRAAMLAAAQAAPGQETVLVSHQLPIWTLRSALEGRTLWHDPRRRECGLCSVTTVLLEDDGTGPVVTGLRYSEPAGDLLRDDVGFAAGA
jgi:broad specificity phosphatase PhoE